MEVTGHNFGRSIQILSLGTRRVPRRTNPMDCPKLWPVTSVRHYRQVPYILPRQNIDIE